MERPKVEYFADLKIEAFDPEIAEPLQNAQTSDGDLLDPITQTIIPFQKRVSPRYLCSSGYMADILSFFQTRHQIPDLTDSEKTALNRAVERVFGKEASEVLTAPQFTKEERMFNFLQLYNVRP